MSITSEQIRAAKAMLSWSGKDLARKAGVSLSSIRRVESCVGIPANQTMKTILAIKNALELAGIQFIGFQNKSVCHVSPEDQA
jgi:predicted transcriptional regulator